MSWGYVVHAGRRLGIDVTEGANALHVHAAGTGAAEEATPTAGAVGLPLAAFLVKDVALPDVPSREVRDAIRLQIAYHLPGDAEDWHVHATQRRYGSGRRLLIVAAPASTPEGATAILPLPLAIHALARSAGALPEDGTGLVCYDDGERLLTVATEGAAVVFMRSVPHVRDLDHDLRLAAQSVYLREERSFFSPDRVVLLRPNDALGSAVERLFDTEVVTLDPDLVHAPGPSGASPSIPEADLESPEWLLAAGIALAGTDKDLLQTWNVLPSGRFRSAALRRAALVAAALLPVAVALTVVGLTQVNRARQAAVEEELRTLQPDMAALADTQRQVEELQSYVDGTAQAMAGSGRWLACLRELEAARPYRVYIASISGRTGDEVVIDGRAAEYSQVTDYMTQLEATGSFPELTLLSTQTNDQGEVSFRMSFRLPDEIPEFGSTPQPEPPPGGIQ